MSLIENIKKRPWRAAATAWLIAGSIAIAVFFVYKLAA